MKNNLKIQFSNKNGLIEMPIHFWIHLAEYYKFALGSACSGDQKCPKIKVSILGAIDPNFWEIPIVSNQSESRLDVLMPVEMVVN